MLYISSIVYVSYERRFVMGKVISLMNEKGGVGKSALTFSCAWELSKKGKRVLIIDLDGQTANVTYLAGVAVNENTETMVDVFTKRISIRNIVKRVPKADSFQVLDIVPANVNLTGISQTSKISVMKHAIREILDDYDYIFIDVNPSPDWRHALTLSVLDFVCVVMKPDVMSLEANDGIFDSIDEVKESINPNLKVLGFVVNCFDPRTRIGSSVVEKANEMAEYYNTCVFGTKIRNAVAFSESAISKMGVTDYSPKSLVAEDLRQFVNELEKAVA